MRILNAITTAGALACLVGCASAPRVAILEPVGPAPTIPAKVGPEGRLQVYSARQREPLAVQGGQWWRWDSAQPSKVLPRSAAQTGYIIRAADGSTVNYVRNARSSTDSTPAVVTLPPGCYQVEARALEPDGYSFSVLLPVVVEPERTTVVHLSGGWKPNRPFANDQVVRLPDGQIAGWVAA